MSEPINLNKFRKAKARVEKQTQAEANAAKFGRTKAEKDQQAQTVNNVVRLLDGHKLDTPKS
jgi:hypothetical protein